ncbi:MAG: DDE-type integrase/transposase/recombinase [Flavobacteriales bacterium]|nr:DDE-type integrase/transposase/recombinase [Flavobacteriales bacterium]
MQIEAPGHVWSTDITYIAMGKRVLYLTAVMDWHSRYVLSWQISNTLDTSFCLEALHGAVVAISCTNDLVTDQGSQYTNDLFTEALIQEGIKVSVDGEGPGYGQCVHRTTLEKREAAMRLSP